MFEYNNDKLSAIEAKFEAQKIAFAPFVFQAAIALRDLGILELVMKSKQGISEGEIVNKTDISAYGIRVLLEVALSSNMLRFENDLYQITKTGYFLLKDELTTVNMNFVNDVCYQGMAHLKQSIKAGYPAGLSVFGEYETIYQALSSLPEQAKKSWFEFDHYYSDISFPQALPLVFANHPKHIVDIGGNTGKWAIQCAKYNPDVKITIFDLAGQLDVARKNIKDQGLSERISLKAVDVLKDDLKIDDDVDLIWMSQFLDCFSEQQITKILTNLNQAKNNKALIMIMELFWDHQRFEAAAYSLHNTSLYFTALANGNSRMYRSDDFLKFLDQAGLRVEKEYQEVGIVHTLLKCQTK